jgi:LysM repeat protein
LEKPIGTDRKFILHRIKGGETFKKYAETYGTNVAAILAVNYEMQFPLWPGTIVVIPLDFTDVNGLPRFEPYQIQNPDLTVESLARAFEVQSSDLLEYNGISDWEQLMVGDWILIPHRVPNQ